jgi:hypothetical protein
MTAICDLCSDAAVDDGVPGDIAGELMMMMGDDFADHLCDEIETDGEIKCSCPCKIDIKRR